jgi:hypothetical protein
MRQALIAMATFGALTFLTADRAESRTNAEGTIDVKFTNATDLKVTFFLNGGQGLESHLKPGESQGFTMVVDDGVQPIVRIYQASGKKLDFTVSDGGRYVFRLKDGEVINFFE